MTSSYSAALTGRPAVSRPMRAPRAPRDRADLTRIPLSRAQLPDVDLSIPPWPGRELTSGGVTLHVRQTPGFDPAAPTAVYVHGLGGAATNWTDFAHVLSGHVNGIAIDLPGFGK